MKTLVPVSSSAKRILLSTLLLAAAIPAAVVPVFGQGPAPRIAGELSSSERAAIPNSATPRAQAQYSTGRLAGSTPLEGMGIAFSRTQAQEAALKTLIASQQNPASPQYHKWLTADQFAARFGLADADIAKVQSWLEQQGFAVTAVSRGKDMIHFSGTAAQAEQAFSTELHTYAIPTSRGTESHFAASTALSIPSALSGVVLGIRGLDDFKPHTHLVNRRGQLHPHYTWNYGGSQEVFFDPGDIATVYDIDAEYKASWTGTGQTITIVGQSAITTTDLTNFWTAAGITRDNPTITLDPTTGASTTLAGDQAESDLDLEWAGAIAPGAALNFVYAGKSGSAFDAIQYAIDNQIGTIVSSSYGDCETNIGKSDLDSLDSIIERAGSQGQTVLSAAGDTGDTDCLEDTGSGSTLTTAQQQAPAVDYPASSAYVTGVGGTQISTASASYQTPGSAYWTANTNQNTGLNDTALLYIPEQTWNENLTCEGYATKNSPTYDDICAGGGGVSAFFSKPSWQTGVENIPQDGMRDVPDVALNAAIYDPGYLLCTSDTSFWDTTQGQKASCNSGFLDSSSFLPTAGGGTSFSTPIFAGMLALINQQYSDTTGQGLVNPTLYTIAASSSYSTAFHDITIGNNACDIPVACGSGTTGNTTYTADAGYDQATGLGSVDLFNLATVWTTSGGGTTPTLITTTTTVTPATTTPALNASDNFTIAVTASDGSTPTGSLSISVDSGTAVAETLSSSGAYTYTTSFSTSGSHTVSVTYAGNSTYTTSTGSATVTVPAASTGPGTFTLSATNVTIAQNSSGASTLTVTPAGGYTGTVDITVKTTSSGLSNTLCYDVGNNDDGTVSITGTTAVTASITLFTSTAQCTANTPVNSAHKHLAVYSIGTSGISGSATTAPLAAIGTLTLLLLAGLIGRSSSKLRGSLRILASLILIAAAGAVFTGCGNSSTGSTSTGSAPQGTYTLTVTGTDSKTSSITASTTFTLIVN